MPVFHVSTCPVCASTEFREYGKVKDYMVSGKMFTLEKCTSCGLIFTQDAPEPDEIGPYYKTDSYISHTDTQQGLMNKMYHRARRIMLDRKQKLFEKLPLQGKSLLDIGAGTGYFAHHMETHGWTVDAIEPDADARQFMQKKFGIIAKDSPSLFEIDQEKYSVVSLWHVLEHVYDLGKYLDTIYNILRGNGYFVLALPNPDSYDAHAQGMEWSAWDVPRHLWHFTPEVTRKLLAKHGFQVVEMHMMPFDGFYNAIKTDLLLGDKLAYVKGAAIGLMALLTGAFNTDRASSLIYVAKKLARAEASLQTER